MKTYDTESKSIEKSMNLIILQIITLILILRNEIGVQNERNLREQAKITN